MDIEEEALSLVKRHDLRNTDWKQWVSVIGTKLQSWQENIDSNDHASDNQAEIFNCVITETAVDIIPMKTVCKHSKQFMTPVLSGLNEEIRKAKNRFKRRRDQHSFYQQALEAYYKAYDLAKINQGGKPVS